MIHYAHIGMGKTGSTYLQRQLFPNFNLNLISSDSKQSFPKPFDFIRNTNECWLDLLNLSQEERVKNTTFLAKSASNIYKWFSLLESFYANITCSSFLSAEGIVGFHPDVCRFNCTLLQLAGVSKVIYVFRKQEDWIFSQWYQIIMKEDRFGRYIPIEDLFNFYDSDQISISANWISYIQVLDEIFGPENVLALPYELLKDSPTCFQSHICKFTQQQYAHEYNHIIENKTPSNSNYLEYRLDSLNNAKASKIKKILPAWAQMLLMKKRTNHSLLPPHYDLLQQNFYSSNIQLQDRLSLKLKLNLKNYGYYA